MKVLLKINLFFFTSVREFSVRATEEVVVLSSGPESASEEEFPQDPAARRRRRGKESCPSCGKDKEKSITIFFCSFLYFLQECH